MNTKKITKWAVVIGSTLSLGFLSFVGTLFLGITWFGLSTVVWGIAAFILAVLIEGLVYQLNIGQALKKWWNSGDTYLKEMIILAMVNKQIELEIARQDPFARNLIQEYRTKKKLLEKLDHIQGALEPIDWVLSPRKFQKLRLKKDGLKVKVKLLEKMLIAHYEIDSALIDQLVADRPNLSNHETTLSLNHIIAREIRKRSARKWILPIRILSLLTGASVLFASLEATQSGITALGIMAGTPTSWVICCLIAIFAAIGSVLLNYHNLTQLFHKKKLGLADDPSSEKITYYLPRIFVSLLSGFMTAAAFWTWVSSGIVIGNQILPFGSIGVSLFIGTLAVAMAVSVFIWNVTNMLNTVESIRKNGWKKLVSLYKFAVRHIKKSWEQNKKEGNIQHFFNIARWIEAPINFLFRGCTLATHGFSIGETTNYLGSVPPIATTLINGSGEILIDSNFLPHNADKKPKKHPDKTCHPLNEHSEVRRKKHGYYQKDRRHTFFRPAPHQNRARHPSIRSHEKMLTNDDDYYQIKELPEEEHTHFDLAGILLVFILLPLKIAIFIIDLILTIPVALLSENEDVFWNSAHYSFKKTFCNPVLDKLRLDDSRTPAPARLPVTFNNYYRLPVITPEMQIPIDRFPEAGPSLVRGMV